MKNSITHHLKNKSFYLIGIGGAGMMGIAELLHNLGFTVHGSDIDNTSSVKRLRKLKIKVYIGHNPKNIKKDDIIIFSNAIKKNNIEMSFARINNMTILSRMEILSELMRLKYGISITGSHGKTTTTSLLSHILYKNHLDPTYLIGGMLKTDDPHVKLGNSSYLITETDESNPDFTKLKPHLVAITNLDAEHLENYNNSFSNLLSCMREFIKSIPFYGKVFINGDDKNSFDLAKNINRNIFTFGFKKNNDLYASDILYSKNKMKFNVHYNKKTYLVSTKLLGKHNVYNVLTAMSVCIFIGIKPSSIITSLTSFHGVSRRFDIHKEISINNKKVLTIDDYGHHPSEIESTIGTIKEIYPNKKILIVFQPHRYSRTKSSWREMLKVLNNTDKIILLPTYSAGEKKTMYDSEFLYKKLKAKNKIYLKSLRNVKKTIEEFIDEDTVLLLQGAGDIRNIINLFDNDSQ
jgi:UDP-N-acetylmuramate--alanine ligase